MGIEGLPEFINEYAKEAVIPHKLTGCRVIIDGRNLMFHLSSKCYRQTAVFGGDYDMFTAEVDKFFNNLLECNVESCVLMDGGVSMKLAAVKWGVHLLKSGIKACALAEPGQPTPNKVHPPLLREVFISRVRSHGITVLQSDASADDDIITLASTFQLPVLSRDSDFCVHGLAIVDLNHLMYSKPVPLEHDPGRHYLQCRVFDKFKFCEVMDIHPDHIKLLATLGMRESLTRFKLAPFIRNISKGVMRDRSKPWSVYKMRVVQQWLSQRKDKTVVQLVEQVLDLMPKYREMRYTLRMILHRLLMVSPSASTLLPWFTAGPDDWPCGHAAFTSSCQAHTENLTTPDLIDKIKAKKEKYAARQVVHCSILADLERQDADCPHAVTNLTFAGGLPLPRWFILSQRLCLLDFDAGEIFAKKTLFSMPLIESVKRASASLVSLPIIQVLLAISEKTFFEYEKSYLMEQLKSLQDTPGEESAQLAETIRGNLSERKFNYYSFKKHMWKLRRACGKEAAAAAGKSAKASNVVSHTSLCKPEINQSTENNDVSTGRETSSSGHVTNEIERLESDFARMVIGSDSKVLPDESVSEISETHDVFSVPSTSVSEEQTGSLSHSSVCPSVENVGVESVVCPSTVAHSPSSGSVDLITEAEVSEITSNGNMSALEGEESYESDGSFHSCIDVENCTESLQITLDDRCTSFGAHEISADHLSCSEIVQDFDFSYFQSNLPNVPLSELVESDYSDSEDLCQVTLAPQKEELGVVTHQSKDGADLFPVGDDDLAYSDSDDDVLIEDDDDPSILYKPSHFDNQASRTASTQLVHSEDSLQLLRETSTEKSENSLTNGFDSRNVNSIQTNGFIENDHSLGTGSPKVDLCIQHQNANSNTQESVSVTSSKSLSELHYTVKNSLKKKFEPKTTATSANAEAVEERNFMSENDFRVEFSEKGDCELMLLRTFSLVTETALRNHFEVTLKKYQRYIEKVELYKKENKLIDGYKEKVLNKMNTFLQKRMVPVLETESNNNLAVELMQPLDGDFEKSLLYTQHSASELLPYAMRPLTFFVRKPEMKSVQVIHMRNEKSLQVPSLLSLPSKSHVERKELLCDFVKLEFKNFKRLPNEIQIVVLSICFWYQNSQQKITYYHVYAVLVSFIMFFFIDQKLGKIRFDEKLKEIVNLESKRADESVKLSANAKDKLKNISYIASHLDGLSCAVAALGLVQYHQPSPTVKSRTFQRHFVHTLSEFQCCYSSIGSLNSFLGSPFVMPTVDRVLNCTFAYNVFCDLSSCKDPGVSLAERLGPKKQMVYLMDALHLCVSDIVLMPRVLNLFPKELKVNTKGKKVLQLVNDVDMPKKLRKEQLRIQELNELAKIEAIVKEIENMDVKKSHDTGSKEASFDKQRGKSSKQSLNKQKKR